MSTCGSSRPTRRSPAERRGARSEPPDRARRRQLLRRSGDRALESNGPRRLPLLRCRGCDDREANPNGSLNHRRHLQRRPQRGWPDAASERAWSRALGSADGLVLFESVRAPRVRARAQTAKQARRTRETALSRLKRGPSRATERTGATIARPGEHYSESRRCAAIDIDALPRTTRPQTRRVRSHRQARLGREPTLTELGIFSVMWSEHCSYKSSRIHLKTLPTTGRASCRGPARTPGAVDIGDGLAAVFKIESHNHPSFIEPYQGAATGVGGIIRDIFTMGARPIALLNSLRFGARRHPRTRNRASSRASSPASPATATASASRPSAARSLRRALRRQPAGQRVLPRHRAADEHLQGHAPGRRQPVYYVGAKTGRDGIHGATMASAEFDEKSTRSGRPCRSAIRSWRSCCSRPASRSCRPTRSSASRTWAPPA